MKARLITVTIVLLVTMVLSFAFKSDYVRDKDEAWLVNMMPTELHGYKVLPSEFGENISYKMDESSYEVLNPIGIACQRMVNDRDLAFDVVVIAGDSMNAFHDQQICFNAQGWEILETSLIDIPTETRGKVRSFMMKIQQEDTGVFTALYMFRSPNGFVSYNQAKVDFFMKRLFSSKPGLGFSYRFIGLSEDLGEDDVVRFASQYLDKLNETTHGQL